MTVTANGCDYAFSHPSIPALKAAGLSFACRYLYPASQNPGTKNLTRDEAAALNQALEHGVVSNYESWASRALDGHAAGVDDARAAQGQHTACGGRMDRPIYFSVDFDAQPGQYPAVDAYMLGVASVIGVNRTGVYGSYSTVKHLLDAGLVKWAWQTYAWSGGRYDERCQLSQDKNGVPLGGAEIDLDSAHAEDFGQWNYNPGEDDMSAADVAAIIAAINNTPQKVWAYPLAKSDAATYVRDTRTDVAAIKATEPGNDAARAALAKTLTEVKAIVEAPGLITLSDEQLAELKTALAAIAPPNYTGTFSPVQPA